MKISKRYASIVGAVTLSLLSFSPFVHAAGEGGNRGAIEKLEKNIAKDKEDITKKMADIKTQLIKIEKDTAEYGQTSNEVKGGHEKLRDLRKDLVDPKVDLYKNLLQKKVELSESIETEAVC